MNASLVKAKSWLNELGINTQDNFSETLLVSRNDVVTLCGGDTKDAHDSLLKELRESFNNNKFFWGGKDTNWLWLQTF